MGVPGIAARTFAAVAAQGANVLMISQASSEQSICFVLPEPDAADVVAALESAFVGEIHRRLIDCVTLEPEVVIVAVVGEGMRGTPGIAAKLFGALGEREDQRDRGGSGLCPRRTSPSRMRWRTWTRRRATCTACLGWRGETGLT